jgi:hypothetical protein
MADDNFRNVLFFKIEVFKDSRSYRFKSWHYLFLSTSYHFNNGGEY